MAAVYKPLPKDAYSSSGQMPNSSSWITPNGSNVHPRAKRETNNQKPQFRVQIWTKWYPSLTYFYTETEVLRKDSRAFSSNCICEGLGLPL